MRQREQDRDPVIREAKARMIAAAEHYNRGLAAMRAELQSASKLLAAHPDYKSAVAARKGDPDRLLGREGHTVAYWLHMLATEDAKGMPGCAINPLEFGASIIGDATGGAEKMAADAIRDEARVGKSRKRRAREQEEEARAWRDAGRSIRQAKAALVAVLDRAGLSSAT